MADTSTDAVADEATEGKKSSGKLKWILIGVVGILLAAVIGGGVAMFLVGFGNEADVDAAKPSKPARALYTKVRTLEGSPYFTVVVASADGRTHYMQLHVEAKSRDDEIVSALTKHMPKIVSVLNQLFSQQSFDELRTVEGKQRLQQAALDEVQRLMQEKIGQPGVEKILFTGFVMQ